MNKISPILVFICIVYSQDIYVDSGMDYEKQYYAKFDRFTKHGGWNNYENASKDEIKLPNNFPKDDYGNIVSFLGLLPHNGNLKRCLSQALATPAGRHTREQQIQIQHTIEQQIQIQHTIEQ